MRGRNCRAWASFEQKAHFIQEGAGRRRGVEKGRQILADVFSRSAPSQGHALTQRR